MSTDDSETDERGDTGDAGEGPTPTPSEDEDVQEAVEGVENEPLRVQDDPGSADEWFARAILATPFVLLLVAAIGGAVLVALGQVTLDVTVAGTIPVRPLVLGFAALLGLSYVLAAAKEWGIRPVKWVAGAARDYRPGDEE
jgi:hypothetical protein